MKLVLIGIQGAGKSTQGNALSKQLHIPYLSTGHIFREIAKEKTQLGRYVKELINSGALIPDDRVIEIVNSYLSRPEYKNGYILDGFPRTLKQAKKFVNNVDRVIHIQIPDKEAVWRLAYRDGEMRDDNTIEAIRKRIELFHTHTEPVLQYYSKKKKLVVVDGLHPIEEVNQEILKHLGKQLIRNKVKDWEQKNKSIIAIVGLPGSGKTEVARFFSQKKLTVVSFGKIINDFIDKKNLPHSEQIHQNAREELRLKHGREAMAVLNKKKIQEALKKSSIIVIDGMRSWEEYTFLKETFKNVRIYILSIYAEKHVRYARIAKREYRSKLFGEKRDVNELVGTNMGPTIAFADFLIKNNFSIEDLYDKLEEIYRTVYFS